MTIEIVHFLGAQNCELFLPQKSTLKLTFVIDTFYYGNLFSYDS